MASFQSLLGLSDLQTESLFSDSITTYTLTVNTSLKIPTGAVNGYILTSDALGGASWQDATSTLNLTGDANGPLNNNVVSKASGNLTINNTLTTTSSSGLVLNHPGGVGTYGPCTLTIINAPTKNGFVIDTTGSSVALTDIVCRTSSIMSMNLRFETRGGYVNSLNSAYGEYQILMNSGGVGTGYFGSGVSGLYGILALGKNLYLNNQVQTKMINLYDSGTFSDQTGHNYYGFGISSSTLRYHVSVTIADHVFFAGTSSTTSNELFRIAGTGAISCSGSLTCGSLTTPSTILRGNSSQLQIYPLVDNNETSIKFNSTVAGGISWRAGHKVSGNIYNFGIACDSTAGLCIEIHSSSGSVSIPHNMYFQQMNTKVLAIGDAGNVLDNTLYNYWGFGLTNTGILRYQVPTFCTHAFYVNDTASTEVMSISDKKMVLNGRFDITTGSVSNIGIGTNSLINMNIASTDNTAVGYTALGALTTGTTNTCIGSQCAPALTTGSSNTCMGALAFNIATTANGCTAIGRTSQRNANGNSNTSVGNNSLNYATGSYNTAVGTSTLSQTTTGTYNACFGKDSFYNSQLGSYNTGCGALTGLLVDTSTNLTCIGYGVDVDVDGWNNSSALGSGTIITKSNQVFLGNNSTQYVTTPGSIYGGRYSNYVAPNSQGFAIGWNRSGSSGRTTFANAQGGGNGGFEWINYNNAMGLMSPDPMMVLDNGGNLYPATSIKLPTIGGTPTGLNYYEQYDHTFSFVGPVTVGPYGLHLTRVGNMITYYCANSPLLATVTASQFTWSASVVLPARFRPVTAINTLVVGRNNNVLTLMNVVIDNAGNMIISVALSSTAFVGTIGFNTFSISWTV